MEANIRQLARSMPTLEFKKGRVQRKNITQVPGQPSEKLKIAEWNLNGWYTNRVESVEFMKEAILAANCDIVALCETHLRNDAVVEVPGFTWFGQNRKTLAPNAVRGSGGVGFLVKNTLLAHFLASVLDSTFEGILWIKLQHRVDQDLCLHMCLCYLPPENTTRGNIAQQFFDNLLAQVYLHYDECTPMLITGDFNARIDSKQDFNDAIDALQTLLQAATHSVDIYWTTYLIA